MLVRITTPVLLLSLLLASLALSAAAAPKLEKRKLEFGGRKRTYHLVVPPDLTGPAPLVIVLHGRGGTGDAMAYIWRPTAVSEHFIVAAPKSLRDGWNLRDDPPQFFRDLVQDVARDHAIDPRRIYLFGFSSGARQAMALALSDANTYAAAVAMGGAVSEKSELLDHAQRKVPLELLIGSEDDPEGIRAVRDAMRTRGFPVKYVEIKDLPHGYTSQMPQINQIAWDFLRAWSLPQ